jgi:hypothetical protein
MPRQKLNAVALKDTLWDTLLEVRAGKLDPAVGDAVAVQAREILRTTKLQCQILAQAKETLTSELVDFAKPAQEIAPAVTPTVTRRARG